MALHRAAHQRLDVPRVFEDPLALAIVGARGRALLEQDARRFRTRLGRALRAFVIARSRRAEEALGEAVAMGTRQYVVLGAGFETFALRNPHAALRVFEVDHPATQAWKRRLMADEGILAPASLTFVPVDFERQDLPRELVRSGFRRDEAAFFSWLGVTIYLSRETVMSTMGFVAGQPGPSGIAFDYGAPPSSLPLLERIAYHLMARRVARAGEPWRTWFEPASLARELTTLGFTRLEDLPGTELNARYFAHRGDGLRTGRGGHVMVAWR